jgi:hypothetical protein
MKPRFQPIASGVAIFLISAISFSVAQDCTRTSVGFKPMAELGAGTYKGYQGGLYPRGQSQRPVAHDSAGRAIALQIKPLNASGTPDATSGKIVLLSIGMSNATQEFSAFKSIADADPTRNPRLTIVDGAQGGQTAAIIDDPTANFWTVVDQRLTSAGVTRQQVQVVWLKEADAGPTQAFPTHALTLQNEMEVIARILKSKFPNVRIAYVSSRTYGGYATTTLNPEPFAYETGFSVKWMIEKQINGDTSLAYSGANVRSPWLSWGPYLWVDGTTLRADGFTWQCTDCQTDGTHPSQSGQTKVANLLLSFFKSDPTATSWFLRSAATAVANGALTQQFYLAQNYPNPFNPATTISYQLIANGFVSLRVFDVLGKEVATLIQEEKPAGHYQVQWSPRLPSGVYYCRLQAGSFVETRKLILLK